MERAIQELQQQMRHFNSGVAASTVAGTDYICGNSGESATDFNNEDGVNIGSNDDIDVSALMMNINHIKDQSQS